MLHKSVGTAEIVGQFMAARDSYGEWPSPKGETPRLLSTIVLMGITPRNDNIELMLIIHQINANIARFADGKKIRYLNINDKLADAEGHWLEGMANADGLHLDVKGYQVWADALKPIFTELLGPPAKTDHAPPPTGDPGVKK